MLKHHISLQLHPPLPCMYCTAHTSNRTVLYDGKVRLRDGDYASMGHVEVYCNNRWGMVCGGVGQDEADTICRQLGYTGAEQFGFSLKRYALLGSHDESDNLETIESIN